MVSIRCVESWQVGYDFENWPSDARIDCSFLIAMGMADFLKVKNKMLDIFEEELEDARSFDSLE